MKKIILFVFSFVFSSFAFSSENNNDVYFSNYKDYLCTISEVWHFSNGKFEKHYLEKKFIGKKFTVDRKSGIITGYFKNNLVGNPVVTSVGSKSNNFKSISITPHQIGSTSVYVLTISEFDLSMDKNFKYDLDEMSTIGKCIHI